VGFMVDQVQWDRGFYFQVMQVSSVSIILSMLHTHSFISHQCSIILVNAKVVKQYYKMKQSTEIL